MPFVLNLDTIPNLKERLIECETNLANIEESMAMAMNVKTGEVMADDEFPFPFLSDDTFGWSEFAHMDDDALDRRIEAELDKADEEFEEIEHIRDELDEVKDYIRTSDAPLAILTRLRAQCVGYNFDDSSSEEDLPCDEYSFSREDSPSKGNGISSRERTSRLIEIGKSFLHRYLDCDEDDIDPGNSDFLRKTGCTSDPRQESDENSSSDENSPSDDPGNSNFLIKVGQACERLQKSNEDSSSDEDSPSDGDDMAK